LLRLKEREELASKSEFNSLKHKFEIVNREKQHVEKGEKSMKENYMRAEEKIMHLRKEIHTEKRKNEVLSRRIQEMEKSLSALSEEMGGRNVMKLGKRKTLIERDSSSPTLHHNQSN